ncbi:MAG TPA: HAMP domain-containing sensor histidine kinase, partial [Gemmatimonadales bacterium]|nr:HAMP domain-containing sensor histidine kinase [Gemmatimonadales bacterium]
LRERLPVQSPSDEVDGVREQFNTLLERLEAAQEGNRRFLRQAAHQIRTPLTLVMGEASLALQGDAPPERDVLDRILRASEQMQRRVGDLFVLAEAQAGSPIPLDDVVDLEELALEVADAARARARQLEHPLMFGSVEPLVVRGNRALLREALLELLENALRHSDPGSTIVLEVHSGIGVSVVSAGPAFDLPPAAPAGPSFEGRDHGLGLSIVQWIASLHGGGLTLQVERGLNRVTLALAGQTDRQVRVPLRG